MKHALFFILAGMTLISCATTFPSEQKLAQARSAQREGEILLYQQEYTAALAKLLAASKILPEDPDLLNSLGLAYLGKEKNELARNTFSRVLEIQPDYREARNNLGAAYLRLEQWDQAIALCSRLADDALYATPHYALANTGWAYLGKKDYDQAQYFFEKALNMEPNFSAASHGMIQVLMQTGKPDLALAYVNACLQRSPETPIYHVDQAWIYENMKQISQARAAWEKAENLAHPRSKLAARARAYLHRLKTKSP